MQEFRHRIDTLLDEYDPDLVVREDFSYSSVNRAFSLGYIGFHIDQACYDRAIPHTCVAPKSRALFAAGNGGASKKQVIQAVARKWGFVTKDDNVADAYALAMLGVELCRPQTTLRAELEVVKQARKNLYGDVV